MNNFKKRVIALSAILCVALSGVVGCSNKNKGSSEEPLTGTPFQFGRSGENISVDTPSVTPEGSDSSSNAIVTDTAGQPVTEIVYQTEVAVQPLTDEAGEPVTDENGEEVTQEVVQNVTEPDGQPVTEVVTVTTPASETPARPAATDGIYATWIDISKNADYVFNGDMMVATLKVRDDAPAGDYTIKVATDFATNAGQSVYTTNNYSGIVRVGGGTIEADEHSSETGFIYYAKNVACNAGDEIQVYFTVQNNPGVVAFMNWFYYDTNVFEFLDLVPCGEFGDISSRTAVGTKPSNN